MSRDTRIQWTDASWNPTRGCSRVSPGCEHCYAEEIAHRFGGPGLPYEGLTVKSGPGKPARWNGEIMLVPEMLRAPLSWRKPKRILVDSMSDLFHHKIPDEFIAQVWAVMALCGELDRGHVFQVLTKRPAHGLAVLERLADPDGWDATVERGAMRWDGLYVSRTMRGHWPLPNVWLGVSAEDQPRLEERLPGLLAMPAAVRFLSLEPLLSRVRIADWLTPIPPCAGWPNGRPAVDWVIVGGEAGLNARPLQVAWVEEIVRDCMQAGVPVFVKQFGAYPVLEDGKVPAWARVGGRLKNDAARRWPAHLNRREFPDAHEVNDG